MKKKLLAVFIAIVLLLCIIVPVSASSIPFHDVQRNTYYYDAVEWALECGVTSGTSNTTFSPKDTCTRGQVVTFLWRSLGSPEPSSSNNSFKDVPSSQYYYKPVIWAIENGITNGTSTTTFSPNDTCTRAQVLTFLWRAEGKPESIKESVLASNYPETYFYEAVAWADTSGMLSDMGSTAFAASDNCPRSDIVTYLYRFAVAKGDTDYYKLSPTSYTAFDPASIPAYSGSDYVIMNFNEPYFNAKNLTTTSYEMYGELDSMGRCTTCVACVGTDIMGTASRGDISAIKPTGWQSVEYDCIEGKYLFNRSHLIGYRLTGENANERNLITGTRYLNTNMQYYENLIAEYVTINNAHVLYRVTPVFNKKNLVATGVLLEGMSVEDQGKNVKFCVFLYNVQPDITIDYATGNNYETNGGSDKLPVITYVLNTNSFKFHKSTCSSVKKIKSENRWDFSGTRQEIINMGYQPCKICTP